MTDVKYGQLWADKDWAMGHRQRLRVVGLSRHGEREDWSVQVNNEDTGTASWILQRRFVKRFRLVEAA